MMLGVLLYKLKFHVKLHHVSDDGDDEDDDVDDVDDFVHPRVSNPPWGALKSMWPIYWLKKPALAACLSQ